MQTSPTDSLRRSRAKKSVSLRWPIVVLMLGWFSPLLFGTGLSTIAFDGQLLILAPLLVLVLVEVAAWIYRRRRSNEALTPAAGEQSIVRDVRRWPRVLVGVSVIALTVPSVISNQTPRFEGVLLISAAVGLVWGSWSSGIDPDRGQVRTLVEQWPLSDADGIRVTSPDSVGVRMVSVPMPGARAVHHVMAFSSQSVTTQPMKMPQDPHRT
jgi:hypothetical protein